MADTLTTITNLINSPPGQLVAGGVLAGIVWKFFERVEAVLTDNTKLEIAVWLVGRKLLASKVEPWAETFTRVFDRVFGNRHLSWRCFWRSCVASYGLAFLAFLYSLLVTKQSMWFSHFAPKVMLLAVIGNALPDYLSLLETRLALRFLKANTSTSLITLVLVANLFATGVLAWVAASTAYSVSSYFTQREIVEIWERTQEETVLLPSEGKVVRVMPTQPILLTTSQLAKDSYKILWILPAFFTSIWLWLYAGSGFILKAARRFDVGFDWFNRKFDIERKPLQSIGLVAGALVALLYWTAALIRHFWS